MRWLNGDRSSGLGKSWRRLPGKGSWLIPGVMGMASDSSSSAAPGLPPPTGALLLWETSCSCWGPSSRVRSGPAQATPLGFSS